MCVEVKRNMHISMASISEKDEEKTNGIRRSESISPRFGGEQWVSCCYRCDKSAVVYFSQLFIGLIVILFCIIQLYSSESCDTDGLYSGIMMVILGSFLPTPKIKKTS